MTVPIADKRRQGRPPVIENARQRILDEACGLFARSGYESSSLSELAEQIGVTKAAIYHYFRSKQEIYDAIIVRTLEGLMHSVKQELAAVTAPEQRVRHFMLAHARYFQAYYWAFVCMLVGFGGMESPGLKSEARRMRRQYEGFLRQILRQGVEDGAFRNVDTAVAARAILSMLNWMVRWFKPGGGRSAEEFASDYFELLAGGLRQPTDGGQPSRSDGRLVDLNRSRAGRHKRR